MMTAIIAALSCMFGWMIFTWIAAQFLGLTGIDLYVVRFFLALIGISGAGIFLWWRSKKEKPKQQAEGGAEAGAQSKGGGDEIDLLARDAEARLAASNIAKGAKIANVPVIFLIGPPGSAKTNVVLHSGLEAELLAGQIYQDSTVLPTRAANFWFARQTVFLEAGGKIVNEPARWVRLVRRAAPGRLAVVGKSEQAPRGAVVCVDLEEFLKPGAGESAAVTARNLHTRLGEISQHLGISFPVYVLFTKTDRVSFFLDYVRNLSQDESTQVFGATLPIQPTEGTGVYAEQATRRLGAAFDDLFYSLADKRIEFLSREHAGEHLPGIYEFPREFRKLRATLVQFLVDVSKPSQLRAAPFLRGFYFSGVRPVIVDEMAPAAVQHPAERQRFEGARSATGIFKQGGQRAPAPAAPAQPRVAGTKRVPQWVFLSHFWNDVLLADHSAIASSGASVRTSTLRRALLAVAAAVCLVAAVVIAFSYGRNSSLESRVLEAAQALQAAPTAGPEGPTADSLKRLDALRQELVTLTSYERDGAPLSMRWGLYTGSALYPEVYRLYFGRLHSLLFGQTQAGMLDLMRRLPPAPAPTDAYAPPYNALKAYLITTSEHKRSTREFLSPYLWSRWSEGRTVDAERAQLIQRQFDFYSDELKLRNPYSAAHDVPAVERAREYLKKFNADERIYISLIEAASKKHPAINYNRMFPNEAVSDSREVRGAFSKDGWAFMQDAFRKPDQIFGGEDWVLGPLTFAGLDRAQLEQKLRGFYYRDFIREWREYLKAGNVSRYQSFDDAAKKLALISGNQSPLLALLCLASHHTNVEAPEVKAAFQAPQQVVPPASCLTQYVGGSNQSYMGSLLKLQTSIAQVAAAGGKTDDPATGQSIQQAQEARLITRQISQTFAFDKEGKVPDTVTRLMEEPITEAERLIKGRGPAELRGKAQGLCGQFGALIAKYPFNPKATTNQATVEDVNRFFRPGDGALWQFYSQSLQPLVERAGAQYVAKQGAPMSVTPAFLGFFNRAVAFTEAAFPGGAQQPRLAYALRSDLAGTNQTIQLTINGQQFTNSPGRSATMKFVWPGTAEGASMTVKFGNEGFNWPPYPGVWAAWEFFGDSEEKTTVGSVYKLEWLLRTGQSQRVVTTTGGQPVSVRVDLDMMGSPPIFRKGYFSGWSCVADVAR